MTVRFGGTPVTGQMLRALRESAELSIREVARRARGTVTISNTHLCRVEQGERTATHAVVAAYERATGIRIDAEVLRELAQRRRPGGVGRQELDTTAAVATVVAGGLSQEHERRLLYQAVAFTGTPSRVGAAEVAQVEQMARLVRSLDLRYGGELAGQLGARTLRWAAGLREATMSDDVRRQLHTSIGVLAQWTAWCAFDADRYETAGALCRVALGSAVRADDVDLRGHVLADVAAQQAHLGRAADALRTVRLAEDDGRTTLAIQCVLHGVRARLHAALGERGRCLREIGKAEETNADIEPDALPEWLGGWEPTHTQAVCGHTFARLAELGDNPADAVEAHKRLATAADELAIAGRVRAAALSLTALAHMHDRCGNPDEAAWWAERAQPLAEDLRSARLTRDLTDVRARANGGSPLSPLTTGNEALRTCAGAGW